MLKSKITNIGDKTPTKYPYLGMIDKGLEASYIVLFNSPNTGMVIQADKDANWGLGNYANNWCEGDFTEFTGTIELGDF